MPRHSKVSGQKDPVIVLLRELQYEEGRARHNLFFAEGEELTHRAFDYGGRAKCVVLTEKWASTDAAREIVECAGKAGVEVYSATEGLLSKILDAKPTPECVAIVERKITKLDKIFAGKCPLVLMVEKCENADNLGMLLRSTDAAGVSGVVLTANTTDPFGRKVVRGSRGAVFTVPICIHHDPTRVIEEARLAGLRVIATSANADTPYTAIDYTKPTMIVIGNEHMGISNDVRELADAIVRIPMLGRINSLNIAVAASMIMYEAVRQRVPESDMGNSSFHLSEA